MYYIKQNTINYCSLFEYVWIYQNSSFLHIDIIVIWSEGQSGIPTPESLSYKHEIL